jgi:uncharacterized protein YebE (UPF0316 family)
MNWLTWSAAGTALMIFCLRICDVSVGTVRVLFTVKGHRLIGASLGIVESAVWIFAISRLFGKVSDPLSMAGWALGFGAGTAVGITLEQWIGHGHVLVRVISPRHAVRLKSLLVSEGFGVTSVNGQGRDGGDVVVMFVVSPRRRQRLVLQNIQHVDPDAFITVEPVNQAIGGYPATAAESAYVAAPAPAAMKK